MTPHPVTPPLRQLGLFDAVCIMVGVVIGAGIYESPSRVASNVPDATALLLVWTFGGLVAFVGALCYAELITTYPSAGVSTSISRAPSGPGSASCTDGRSSS
jgi:amino acid transporter